MMRIDTRRGFTLVELLIVIAIIGVLVGLLLTGVQSIRETARRTQCANNMKQIGLAANAYHAVNNHFPIGSHNSWRAASASTGYNPQSTHPLYDWMLHLLPFVEMEPLYSQLTLVRQPNRPWMMADYNYPDEWYWYDGLGNPILPFIRNIQTQLTPVPLYTCPSMPGFPMAAFCCYNIPFPQLGADDVAAVSYSAISTHAPNADQPVGTISRDDGQHGMPNPNASGIIFCMSRTPVGDVVDGTSNTLLFTEVYQNYDEPRKAEARARAMEGGSTGSDEFEAIGQADLYCPIGRCNLAPGWGFGAHTTTSFGINQRQTFANLGWYYFSTRASINSFHRGGALFGMADGSVRFLADTIPLAVLQTLGTRKPGLFSGELTLGNDQF